MPSYFYFSMLCYISKTLNRKYQFRQLSDFNALKHFAVTVLHSGCWHQTGTWVIRSKITQRYKKRLHSFDCGIDNLDMFKDFIHFIGSFCQFHDNSSSVMCDQPYWPQFMPTARNAARFHCLLLEPHSDHSDNEERQQGLSLTAGFQPHPLRT